MWSSRRLRKFFRETEHDFNGLWKTLEMIKFGIPDGRVSEVFSFQYRLGCRLRELQETYNSIKKEENSLILRKPTLSKTWFVRRMNHLGVYKKAVTEVSSVGKGLGDIFAYYFYQNDHELLASQLEREEISSFPTGDGGLGELAFIRTNKHYENHFTIYHGITNILRHGDVSFFNLADGRISGIGELKTQRVADNELTITLTTIGPIDKKPDLKKPIVPHAITQNMNEKKSKYFDQERAKRQLDGIKKAFKPKNYTDTTQLENTHHFDQLAELFTISKPNKFNHMKVGPGLLYICVPSRKAMYSRFLKKQVDGNDEAHIKAIKELNLPGSNFNDLIVGSFLFKKKGKPQIEIGYAPIFYSDLPIEHLKKMYLAKASVVTIFNPAHIFNELLNLGFSFNRENQQLVFRMRDRGGDLLIPGFSIDMFLSRILNHGHSEKSIIDLFKAIIEYAHSKPPTNANITISLTQHLGRPPKEKE